MEMELIKTAGVLAVNAVKNSRFTFALAGWPAAAAVVGLGIVAGITISSIVSHEDNGSSDSSYDI
ncbi:MAG: hypothetical protein K6A70_04145 [Erysipelotrichaceae bacterium]|nr:hypothetical protein [Erysipelotrichaceae bacterium]